MLRKASMKKTGWILLCGVMALLVAPTRAADIAGQWRGEFDSQRVELPAAATASATNGPGAERPRPGARGFGGPIVLGPDDKAAFDDPPAGFDKKREDIPHGKLEMIEYDSKTVGTTRKMQ